MLTLLRIPCCCLDIVRLASHQNQAVYRVVTIVDLQFQPKTCCSLESPPRNPLVFDAKKKLTFKKTNMTLLSQQEPTSIAGLLAENGQLNAKPGYPYLCLHFHVSDAKALSASGSNLGKRASERDYRLSWGAL